MTRRCRVCKSVFLTFKNQVLKGGGIFCSRECFAKHRSGKALPEWWREKLRLSSHVPKGPKSLEWKGDEVGYAGLHAWLRREFGKADRCEGKNCSKKSSYFNWALIKGKQYERKRENFIRLCVSCHRKMDYTDSWRNKLTVAGMGNTKRTGLIPWNKGRRVKK